MSPLPSLKLHLLLSVCWLGGSLSPEIISVGNIGLSTMQLRKMSHHDPFQMEGPDSPVNHRIYVKVCDL